MIDQSKWTEFQKGFIGLDALALPLVVALVLLLSIVGTICAYRKFMTLRRQDTVKIIRGFYQGYVGTVLSKKSPFVYGVKINSKEVVNIPRWNMEVPPTTRLRDRLRKARIEKDR